MGINDHSTSPLVLEGGSLATGSAIRSRFRDSSLDLDHRRLPPLSREMRWEAEFHRGLAFLWQERHQVHGTLPLLVFSLRFLQSRWIQDEVHGTERDRLCGRLYRRVG